MRIPPPGRPLSPLAVGFALAAGLVRVNPSPDDDSYMFAAGVLIGVIAAMFTPRRVTAAVEAASPRLTSSWAFAVCLTALCFALDAALLLLTMALGPAGTEVVPES